MEPYVGEIRMFGGNYAPQNWMFCNGQMLSVSQYQVLFTLLGTTYGGDGVSTFALPDLQCRIPVNPVAAGTTAVVLGQKGGSENNTLTAAQLAPHSHQLNATAQAGDSNDPTGRIFGNTSPVSGPVDLEYIPDGAGSNINTTLNAAAIQDTSYTPVPVNNLQPFVTISFIIAITGIYPSPN